MFHLDHILYAVPDLDQAMDDFERRAGVRPAFGGKHTHLGTHNALVSLGEGVYFEIIAPDPEVSDSQALKFLNLDDDLSPKLITWAVRTEDIEDAARHVSMSSVELGGRRQADGVELKWKNAEFLGYDESQGLVPFVIDWLETTHPSQTSPQGCRLVRFSAEHPEPERFEALWKNFPFSFEVSQGPEFRLKALIETPLGVLEI